jgi:glycerophosphoryl diester phosphodiesterase
MLLLSIVTVLCYLYVFYDQWTPITLENSAIALLLSSMVLFRLSCFSRWSSSRSSRFRGAVISHRIWDSHAHVPENSRLALQLLAEHRSIFDGFETDIHLTNDCEFVVNHDLFLERCTSGRGFIKHLNIGELLEVRLKNRVGQTTRERLLTLADICEYLVDHGDVLVVLDVKAIGRAKAVAKNLTRVLRDYHAIKDRVLVASFGPDTLYHLTRLDPKVETALLSTFWPLYRFQLQYPKHWLCAIPHWLVTLIDAGYAAVLLCILPLLLRFLGCQFLIVDQEAYERTWGSKMMEYCLPVMCQVGFWGVSFTQAVDRDGLPNTLLIASAPIK